MSNRLSGIIYINLDRRMDRRDQIENELESKNLTYERFSAISHPTIGLVGCGLSHLSVLKIAKERKLENVLIFEDDFQFLISLEEFEKQMEYLWDWQENNNFDVCMLSYNLFQSQDISKHFLRVLDAQTASGYIVNYKHYDTLINLLEKSMPLLESTGKHWLYANDQVWKQLQRDNMYICFKIRIGQQRASFSDNSNCFCDFKC